MFASLNNPYRASLPTEARALVRLLGETDQQSLNDTSFDLICQRAEIRQALAELSVQQGERLYLLSEAAVLLETALLAVEDQAWQEQLSTQLADVYLQFYQYTHEQKYLTVVGQILKPLSHSNHPCIQLNLVRLYAASQQPALTQYRLRHLAQHHAPIDWDQLADIPELRQMQHEAWFIQLKQQALH